MSKDTIPNIPAPQASPAQHPPAAVAGIPPLTGAPDRGARRLRHELRFRLLEVIAVERPSPHLVRVTLGGEDLAGFDSPGFDDHCKLFFPDEATGRLILPEAGPNGAVFDEGKRPTMRDYTPHGFDADARRLQFDFVLHDAGPATRWAVQAAPGQKLGVGGPRGSFIVPTEFDWHLLVGDATALPAIGRRLRELPDGARAIAVIEVAGPEDEITLPTRARLDLHWVHAGSGAGVDAGAAGAVDAVAAGTDDGANEDGASGTGADAAPGAATPAEADEGAGAGLLERLETIVFPPGDYYAWVGAESAVSKALREHLVGERGANPDWLKASSYWRRGRAQGED